MHGWTSHFPSPSERMSPNPRNILPRCSLSGGRGSWECACGRHWPCLPPPASAIAASQQTQRRRYRQPSLIWTRAPLSCPGWQAPSTRQGPRDPAAGGSTCPALSMLTNSNARCRANRAGKLEPSAAFCDDSSLIPHLPRKMRSNSTGSQAHSGLSSDAPKRRSSRAPSAWPNIAPVPGSAGWRGRRCLWCTAPPPAGRAPPPPRVPGARPPVSPLTRTPGGSGGEPAGMVRQGRRPRATELSGPWRDQFPRRDRQRDSPTHSLQKKTSTQNFSCTCVYTIHTCYNSDSSNDQAKERKLGENSEIRISRCVVRPWSMRHTSKAGGRRLRRRAPPWPGHSAHLRGMHALLLLHLQRLHRLVLMVRPRSLRASQLRDALRGHPQSESVRWRSNHLAQAHRRSTSPNPPW